MIFCTNQSGKLKLFNKKIKEERFDDVYYVLLNRLNGWYPEFNNLKSLYLQSGSKWECTPIPNAKSVQKEEAWKDMPQPAIDYVKSLPEFNAKIFFEITGLK
jgi:hypothetical protein